MTLMKNSDVGQLLAEYLRVINDKDREIHKLIKGLEALRASRKKAEDQFSLKISLLKSEMDEKSNAEMFLKNKVAENELMISSLIAANGSLKSDLQAKDMELEEVSSKLLAQNEQLQKEIAVHVKKIDKFRQQLEVYDEELKGMKANHQQQRNEEEKAKYLMLSNFQSKFQSSEKMIHELSTAVATLQNKLQDSISRQDHKRCVEQLEAKSKEDALRHEGVTVELKENIRLTETKIMELKDAFAQSQRHLQEAVAERESSEKAVAKLRQQNQEYEHALETSRRDAEQWKDACAKMIETGAERERIVASKDDQLRHLMGALEQSRSTLEQVKAQAKASEKSLHAQLAVASDQVNRLQRDTKRYREQLESKESALQDAATTLATFKENATFASNSLRDQLATTSVTASMYKGDNERLKDELKQSQQKQQEVQNTFAQEVKNLRAKVEELHEAVQTNSKRLRDKQEEVRRLEIMQEKALKDQKHEHTIAIENLCRSKDTEIKDMLLRLERCRAELSDNSRDNKKLSQTLQENFECIRELKEELGCVKSSLRTKDEMIASLKGNLEDAKMKIERHEQRYAECLEKEHHFRRRMEAVERDRHVAEEDLAQTKRIVTERNEIVRKLEETITKIRDENEPKEMLIQTLRRQLAENQGAEQLFRTELNMRDSRIEKLTHRLEQADAELEELRIALKEAQRARSEAESALEAAETEVLRFKRELEGRSLEFKHTADHAKELEEMVRKKAEELRQAIESRNETIATLQRERATILPHLNEEQSKNLVLKEKLQHRKEMEELTLTRLQERVADLETTLQYKEDEIVASRDMKAKMQRQITQLERQLQDLQEASESRARKHLAYKEELRKAYAALEVLKVSSNNPRKRSGSEVASPDATHRRHLKKKDRVEGQLKHPKEKAHEAIYFEKGSRDAESMLLKDSQVAQMDLVNHKRQWEQMIALHKELYEKAAHNAAMAEQKCIDLEHKLVTTQENAASARSACMELEQSLRKSPSRHVDYAEEVIALKTAFGELTAELHRETVEHVRCCLHATRLLFEKYKHKNETNAREQVDEMTLQLNEMKGEHDLAMDRELKRHHAEISRLREQHRIELMQSRHVATERAYAHQHEDEVASWALQEQALHRATVGLESARVEVVHLRKQLHTLRGQRDAAEARLSELQRSLNEEREIQLQESDTIRRRLNDTIAQHRHNEEEMRELRAEITALQQLVSEQHERVSAQRAKLRANATKLKQAQDARDSAISQLIKVKDEVDTAKSELDAMKKRDQAIESLQEARFNDKIHIEQLQAELNASKLELRRLQQYILEQQLKIDTTTRELQKAQLREVELHTQVQSLTSDISALSEKCANLESLKHISDSNLTEMQLREGDLMVKLEEFRNSQQLMQLCFDKQQEQLEMERRLRRPKN